MIYAVTAIILITFILCAPLKAEITFQNKTVGGRILLWGVPVYKISPKKKKETEKAGKPPEEKVKTFERKSQSLGEKIRKFADLCKTAVKLLRKFVEVKDVTLNICVGTGDAATTAVSAGILWAAVYGLLGIVGRVLYIGKHDVKIAPDYVQSTFSAEGKCIIESRIVYIIIIAITILIKINSLRGKED